jgi:hypothetical protein
MRASLPLTAKAGGVSEANPAVVVVAMFLDVCGYCRSAIGGGVV